MRRVAAAALLSLCLLPGVSPCGCSAPTVERPQDGPCAGTDLAAQAGRARRSLIVRRYRPGPVYDVDAADRAVPLAIGTLPADSEAVLSYPDVDRYGGSDPGFRRMRGRSFVYDAALYALWRLHEADPDGARRILQTLAALQRPDGAWGFSFHVEGDGFYNAAYVRSGAVAWVAYALARWQQQTGDFRFDPALRRAITWLLAQTDPATGLVRGGSGRWRDPAHFEPDWRADFAATEHQIDVWYALRAAAAARTEVGVDLRAAAARLATAVERHLWLAGEERYAQGYGPGGADRESALDASGTWAALYAIGQGEPGRAQDLLTWVEQVHGLDVAGWRGLRPYRGQPPATWFVEGALARPLALQRLGEPERARKFLQPFADLACAGDVPLVYSPVWAPDFPLSPATAPTVWFLFAVAEIAEGRPPFLWTETP